RVEGKTVLFVGAGRHQRRAIQRAKELGVRVVAVDRNPDAAGLGEADAAETVDFQDTDAVIDVARQQRVDGVLTISADRAVPVVAHLHAALAESAEGEVILERFHDGLELNGLVIARGGSAFPLTLSDRLRPPGVGFGVGWIHVYPATVYGAMLEEAERVAVHAV